MENIVGYFYYMLGSKLATSLKTTIHYAAICNEAINQSWLQPLLHTTFCIVDDGFKVVLESLIFTF